MNQHTVRTTSVVTTAQGGGLLSAYCVCGSWVMTEGFADERGLNVARQLTGLYARNHLASPDTVITT